MKTRKGLSLFLAVALVMSSFAGSELQAKKKSVKAKVSSVKITNVKKKLRIQKGKKFRLKTSVKVKPNQSKYKKLKFTSSNRKIVLVNSKGLLKGLKKGTAKITAASKINPKKKAVVKVTVTKDVLVKSITLNRTKITADEFNDQDIQLKVKKISPSNAKNKKVEWSTSDEDVADVDEDGVVTTGDVGTAVITATAADQGGAQARCTVTVTENRDQGDEQDDSDFGKDQVQTAPPLVNSPASDPDQDKKEPVNTVDPGVSIEPTTSGMPDVSGKPVETKDPEITEEPERTERPAITEEPERTEKPAVTEQPEKTERPEVTAKPEDTGQPVKTAEPSASSAVTKKTLTVSAVSDWLMPGDITQMKAEYSPEEPAQSDVTWGVDNEFVTIHENGKLEVGTNFEFGRNETEKLVVVTATSKIDPSVVKRTILTVYDPDQTEIPKLENPDISLFGTRMTDWSLSGVYGQVSLSKNGTVLFNSENTGRNGEPGIYFNGVSWYLDNRRARTDVSDYKFVTLTLKADEDTVGKVEFTTRSGSDDSEAFWSSSGTFRWDNGFLDRVRSDDGETYTLVYQVDRVFTNPETAKTVGIKIQSCKEGTDASSDTDFEVKEAEIESIRFTNELPEGSKAKYKPLSQTTELTDPALSLEKDYETSWVAEGPYGTTVYNEDGTVSFSSQPSDPEAEGSVYNNGCGWYLDKNERPVDVSGYKYLFVKVKSDKAKTLMTWSGNADPEGYYNHKAVYTPGTELLNSDGTKTLVYRVSTVFANTKRANVVGMKLNSYSEEEGDTVFEPGEATIYGFRFSNTMPETDEPWILPSQAPATPKPEPTRDPYVPEGDGWYRLDLSTWTGESDNYLETGDQIILSDTESEMIPLPRPLDNIGDKIEVIVRGAIPEDSNGFRFWVANDWMATLTQQYHYSISSVGVSPQTNEMEFEPGKPFEIHTILMHTNHDGVSELSGTYFLMKGYQYGETLDGTTVSGVWVRYPDTDVSQVETPAAIDVENDESGGNEE